MIGNHAQGQLTLITSEQPAILGKTYRLQGGKLVKDTAGHMVRGMYAVQDFDTVEELRDILLKVRTDQAICASLPLAGKPAIGTIVSKSQVRQYPQALTRTKDCFTFQEGAPGILTLDYDPSEAIDALTPDALWTLLKSIAPKLATAGVLHWSSGSSHIWNGTHELQGRRGQRLYVMVTDSEDVPRASKVLADRLWLSGHGRIAISTSGSKLIRHIFDDAMGQPARLDFIGGAICEAPLDQRRGSPTILADGGFLDTREAFPNLTVEELTRVEALQADALTAAEAEASIVRTAWKAGRVKSISDALVRAGVPTPEAVERGHQAARSALSGVLLGDYPLILEGGQTVTVGEVLDHRDKYHGLQTCDPLEPDYLHGKIVGRLFLWGARPNLHSFAHGSKNFSLQRQPARIYLAQGRRTETVDEIARRLDDEPDLFLRGGILVRLCAGRLIPLLKPAQIAYLIGSRFALFRKGREGNDVPCDLDDNTSGMLLGQIGTRA